MSVVQRILIIGVQQFIGFHLGMKYLEKGWEVDGVFIEPKDVRQKKLAEEEMMWLGRNAFFRLWHRDDWLEHIIGRKYRLIYDCETFTEHSGRNETGKRFEKTIKVLEKKEAPIIFLFSCEYCDDQLKCKLEQQLQELGMPHLFVHVPTVFGAWQPLNHWMTKCMLEKTENANENVFICDLLHIEEVIQILLEIDDELIFEKNVFISSNDEGRVKKVMDFLKLDRYSYSPPPAQEMKVLVPRKKANIETSLKKLDDFFAEISLILDLEE